MVSLVLSVECAFKQHNEFILKRFNPEVFDPVCRVAGFDLNINIAVGLHICDMEVSAHSYLLISST